jgi:hypothetical protein
MLERDVSKFNPNGVAPHTIYRDMMTKLADRPVNDYVTELTPSMLFIGRYAAVLVFARV